MSDTPSCATIEPSMYSTIECTIDSGWTTMSIRRGSTSKSHRASITSSPLFIRVAESMVILSPIDQFGWRSARAGLTSRSSAAGTSRSGPPEAVRRSRRTSARLWPTSDWWMALCSESTGRIVAPRSTARRTSSSPARTSDSLLARPIAFPASMAAAVERSPAPPEIAASTNWTSGWEAAATAPPSPGTTSTPAGTRARRSRAAASSATATSRGRKRATCSASRATLRPAESATTSKRSGKREMTSSACTPMEPVEPRMARRFTGGFLARRGAAARRRAARRAKGRAQARRSHPRALHAPPGHARIAFTGGGDGSERRRRAGRGGGPRRRPPEAAHGRVRVVLLDRRPLAREHGLRGDGGRPDLPRRPRRHAGRGRLRRPRGEGRRAGGAALGRGRVRHGRRRALRRGGPARAAAREVGLPRRHGALRPRRGRVRGVRAVVAPRLPRPRALLPLARVLGAPAARAGRAGAGRGLARPAEPARAVALEDVREVRRAHVDPGADEQERVDPVEQAAVARDDPRRVLHARAALEHRFGEIAERPEEGAAEADAGGRGRRQLAAEEQPARDERAGDAPHHPAGEPLPGLRGREALVHLVAPEEVAREVGEGVVRPGDDEREDHPAHAEPEPQADERREGEPAVEPGQDDEADRLRDLVERLAPEEERRQEEDRRAGEREARPAGEEVSALPERGDPPPVVVP